MAFLRFKRPGEAKVRYWCGYEQPIEMRRVCPVCAVNGKTPDWIDVEDVKGEIPLWTEKSPNHGGVHYCSFPATFAIMRCSRHHKWATITRAGCHCGARYEGQAVDSDSLMVA